MIHLFDESVDFKAACALLKIHYPDGDRGMRRLLDCLIMDPSFRHHRDFKGIGRGAKEQFEDVKSRLQKSRLGDLASVLELACEPIVFSKKKIQLPRPPVAFIIVLPATSGFFRPTEKLRQICAASGGDISAAGLLLLGNVAFEDGALAVTQKQISDELGKNPYEKGPPST